MPDRCACAWGFPGSIDCCEFGAPGCSGREAQPVVSRGLVPISEILYVVVAKIESDARSATKGKPDGSEDRGRFHGGGI
jgi:hypothetical protein